MLSYADERNEFINICQRAFLLGMQLSTGGNVSLKLDDDVFLVKPTGISLFDLEAGQLLLTDKTGRVMSGGGNPTKEFVGHAAIYETRPDVRAVAHYHPAYATAFAVRNITIPLLTVHARRILKDLPLVPADPEGGPQLAGFLKEIFSAPEVRGAVMSEHGIVAVGKDLKDAQNIAELIEESARIALLSSLILPAGEKSA
jgi:L-fuculose-phosphate aldolase